MSVTPATINTPAGFAPAYAVGYSDTSGQLTVVSDAAPLPVSTTATASPPLAGEASISVLAGPFEATEGRVVVVSLDGTWTGSIHLLRSTDGGATKLPLRAGGQSWGEYSIPGCEQAWFETETGASFYLEIMLASGTVIYRVSQ